MKYLASLALVFLASCIHPKAGGEQKFDISNRTLTSAAKISLEDYTGREVLGTVFPVYSEEIKRNLYINYFVTAAHVVKDATPKKIEFYSRPENNSEISHTVTLSLFKVKVVYVDANVDFAVVKAKSSVYIPFIELSRGPPKFMEKVVSVGCPFGEPLMITEGKIIRQSLYDGMWLTTAPAVPGNSGGPVISLRTGKVVGITSRVYVVNNGLSSSYIGHMHEIVPSYIFRDKVVNIISEDLFVDNDWRR